VYRTQVNQAARLIASGASVIAGAVFDRAETRLAIETAAAGAPFTGVWLTADPRTLAERIVSRPASASDATPGVLEQQLRKPPVDMTWTAVDATAGDPATTVETIRRLACA
jgi:hypothetical protein